MGKLQTAPLLKKPAPGIFQQFRTPVPIGAGLILLGFLALTVWSAQTKEPWEDESWFGTATYNLATKGSLSNDVLEGQGTWRDGMKHHFYWEPPLSFVVNAGVSRIVGFSLFTIRSVSIGFGAIALLCAFLLTKKLTGSEQVGLLAMTLVSCDYFFLVGSSDGRMDAMCMALGFGGITAYLLLREKSMPAAMLLAQSCVAASGITHPNGVIWFVSLSILILALDRRRLRPSLLALAAVPYLVGALGWGAFIAQDPADFKIQFLGNVGESSAANTLSEHPLKHPIEAITDEVTERYIYAFGLGRGEEPLKRLKGFVLLVYTGALVTALATRKMRQSMAFRVLLVLIVVSFFEMAFVMGDKMSCYLIQMTPLLAILTAVVLASAISRGLWARRAVWGIVAAMISLQAGGLLYQIGRNTYGTLYMPAVAVIRANSKPGDLVLGSSAFFWTLRGERKLTDDVRLGYYSHAQPDLIVISPFYDAIVEAAKGDIGQYFKRKLALYSTVPFQGEYQILARKPRANRMATVQREGYQSRRRRKY